MRKLVHPLLLVFLSLFSAAALTTATAVTLASYSKHDKEINVAVKQPMVVSDHATVSR